MATTLRDIAAACGCDTSTVSRALRGDGRLSADLRDRIIATAARLGYRPNLAARHLVTGRTRTVWMLSGGLEAPTDHLPAIAAASHLRGRGYDLLVAVHQGDREGHDRLLGRMRQQVCDGAIILASHLDQDSHALVALAATGFPIVFVDRHVPGIPAPVVTSANKAACAGLVAAAAAAGAQRAVILFGRRNTVDSERLDATHAALRDHGMVADGRGPVAILGQDEQVIRRIMDQQGIHPCMIGVFDRWTGPAPQDCTVVVQPQDFTSMAEVASDLLLDRMEQHVAPSGKHEIPCPAAIRIG